MDGRAEENGGGSLAPLPPIPLLLSQNKYSWQHNKTRKKQPKEIKRQNKLIQASNEWLRDVRRLRDVRPFSRIFRLPFTVFGNFANCFKVEIYDIPLNRRSFTPLVFSISPAGCTRRGFFKLKDLGNIGCENWKYMWFYAWFRFIFWRNISQRLLKQHFRDSRFQNFLGRR